MFKKKRTWIIIIIVLVVILIIFAINKGKSNRGFGVTVEEARIGSIIETVSANGKIQPAQDVIISPYISGEVVELYVKEGDEVKKGDLLVKIDPEIYISAYERAEANLNSQQANLANSRARYAQAEASFANEKVSFERNKSLFEQEVISQAEFDAAIASFEVAKAEVDAAKQTVASAEFAIKSAEATLRESRDNLNKTTVSAPNAGTISKLNVEKGERVGVLLPNAKGAAVTFFALQAFGRVPAMLNFSTGINSMLSALKGAEIRTVLTSRRFIERGQLQATEAALSEKANMVYLEDMVASIGMFDKLRGLAASHMPALFHDKFQAQPDDPAVVLFTSGSEGAPKGVVLSHRNILSNVNQLAARVDFNGADVVFNALPIFHSFGLTGGLLLPMLSGVKTFLYPSPLHYRIVPALVYDTNATIMFGTDTFLSGYARVAHPYDFYSVRYVFAGAEKVKDRTRQTWSEKFGLRLLEGYGATETSPVLSTNTPMHYRAGTVGRFLPGITYDLEPVPGVERGGRLVVQGPNVMLGYLKEDAPGELQPPEDGRYDTGDIVSLDAEGFVTIEGRAKRFAKIAGEMVSLTAVEGLAAAAWPDTMNAAVSIPDDRKGEQIVLLTDNPAGDRSALLKHAQSKGVPELYIPRTVKVVDAVPVLGTGKTDYVSAQALANNMAG